MESMPTVFLLLLIISTVILYIFPFLPAILEWKWKTDASPFKIDFQDKTIVDYCIRTFEEYIEKNFASLIKEYKNSDSVYKGKTRHGRGYIISAQTGLLPLTNKE